MSLLNPNLQAFFSIYNVGTVHGAAAELGLTQTAVPQRIRALESQLKTTLFLRSRKGMKLTSEGEVLLRYCKGAIDLAGETLGIISGSGENQNVFLSLAGPTSVMTSRVIEQCAKLFDQWPQLYLNFIITDTEDRLALVRSGKAALAIVSVLDVPNEMDSKILKSDKYVLVASKKWKGRRINDILTSERLIDFYESDSTSLNYLKKFELAENLGRPRLFANNNEAVIKLFCEAVGFGTLTQEIAKPHLESGDLIALNGGATMEDSIALTWYPRPEMPAYFRSVITAIR